MKHYAYILTLFLAVTVAVPSQAFSEDRIFSSFDWKKIKGEKQNYFAGAINATYNICRGWASEYWRLKNLDSGSHPCIERAKELIKNHDGKSNIITQLCEDEKLIKANARLGVYVKMDGHTKEEKIEACKREARSVLPYDQRGKRDFFDQPYPPIPNTFPVENQEESFAMSDSVIDAIFDGCRVDSYSPRRVGGCVISFLDSFYDPSTSVEASHVFAACGTENGTARIRPPKRPGNPLRDPRNDGEWAWRETCFEKMSQIFEGPFFYKVYHSCKDFKPETRRTVPRVLSSTIETVGTPIATVGRTAGNVVDGVATVGGDVLGNVFWLGTTPIQLLASSIAGEGPKIGSPPGFRSIKSPLESVEVKDVGVVTDNEGVRPYDCYVKNYQEAFESDVARTKTRQLADAARNREGALEQATSGDQKVLPSADRTAAQVSSSISEGALSGK